MDLLKTLILVLATINLPYIAFSQYAYFPNDIKLIEELDVKQERIRYSDKLGDTSIFETNLFDENANLIQYKSKENMPIQAKIIFHYDDANFCYKVDYYRNHIFYQYKEVNKTAKKQVERFYSVTGKYKGLQQTTFFNEKGQEEKLIIKRKKHPKVTRKYTYHENGNIKQIWLKKGGKPTISNYDVNGDPVGIEKTKETPLMVLESYDENRARIDMRTFTVSDILPKEVVKVGKGHQEEYSMEMYTYYHANGLNEQTQICIEDKLMYSYFFDYTFHRLSPDAMVSKPSKNKPVSLKMR